MVHRFRKKGVFFSFYPPCILEKGGIFHNACGEKNVELTLHKGTALVVVTLKSFFLN